MEYHPSLVRCVSCKEMRPMSSTQSILVVLLRGFNAIYLCSDVTECRKRRFYRIVWAATT